MKIKRFIAGLEPWFREGAASLLVVGLALTGAGIFGLHPAFANDKKDAPPSKAPFFSSTTCGRCHVDIYDHWRNSLHARSVEDPIFRTAYFEAYTTSGGEAKHLCLKCHAPTTQLTGDYELKEDISKEGITCDFCHSIKEMSSKDGKSPYEVETGLTKRGPWKDAKSPFHKTEYSPLFESSSFCSGCHEFTNQHGLRVLETYSEWERSPYAKEGVTCQNCHMPRVEGIKVVAREGAPVREYVNLHRLAGASSISQLKRALSVDITDIERQGGELLVEVALSNHGAGHMVPTGLPGRAVVLEVSVRSGGTVIETQQQSYKKIVLDEEGNEIEKVAFLFGGHSIAQDNRLAPKEVRKERFRFKVPSSRQMEVSTKVFYLYEPHLIEKKQVKVEVVNKERVAPAAASGAK